MSRYAFEFSRAEDRAAAQRGASGAAVAFYYRQADRACCAWGADWLRDRQAVAAIEGYAFQLALRYWRRFGAAIEAARVGGAS